MLSIILNSLSIIIGITAIVLFMVSWIKIENGVEGAWYTVFGVTIVYLIVSGLTAALVNSIEAVFRITEEVWK